MTFEARDSATKIVPTAPQGPQKEQVNFYHLHEYDDFNKFLVQYDWNNYG